MKVELSIADDRELRTMIKDTIKGEVVSIARGEIKEILASVVREGVLPKSPEQLDYIVREEIRKIVREEIYKTDWARHGNRLQEITREEVRKLIGEVVKATNQSII
jgi:hypothetical protein